MLDPAAISWLSDRALRIATPPNISPDHAIAHACHVAHAIRAAALQGVDDITLAYAAVQVRVSNHIGIDPRAASDLEARVRAVCNALPAQSSTPSSAPSSNQTPLAASRIIDIPVCYDADFALDLAWLAHETRLTIPDLIALHTGATYHVHFLGFLPGFAYMGGVPQPLRVPRHASPRTRVPAGSVAIAGAQAGIYPSDTPGGWRILGRTPLTIFNPARNHPSLLLPGDRVRFRQIDRAQFDHLSAPRPPTPIEPTPIPPNP